MRITFKNPDNQEFVGTVTFPWVGALVYPVRTIKLVWAIRKIVRMPDEQAQRAMHTLADAFEARGMNVTREETRRS